MKDHNTFENSEITILLTKFARGGVLSTDERKALDFWAKESHANQQIIDRISDPNLLASDLIAYDQSGTEAGLKNLNRILDKQEITRRYRAWFIPAAAVLLISLSISLFLIRRNSILEENSISTYQIQQDILPGTNKATLHLSNGKTIPLDGQKQGIVISDSSFNYVDGSTALTDLDDVHTAVIRTPRAGQYDIVLPDGSKVSLNAESSLEYPVRFTGSERRVKLAGEGYFEVAHDKKKPFHVETKNQDIKVLGTVFNVRAYSTKENTTLLTGKVLVSNSHTDQSFVLAPGQNATASHTDLRLQDVDIQDYTGWKNGLIGGSSMSLAELLAEVGRWYDVQISVTADLHNTERALVSINRQEKLSVVLNVIRQTYGVNYQIKGKEVVIRQK